MVKLTIELPEEFEEHFQTDKFKDSLHRVEADLRQWFYDPCQLSGNYEIELIEQLGRSFSKAELIDERPARLVRAYKVLVTIQFADGDYSEEEYDGVLYRDRSEAEAQKIIAETCYGIEKARIIELTVDEGVFDED